jgi:very-short-patch-repair endonuclease
LDGDHHFKQVSNWQPPEEVSKRDTLKNQKAINNGYTIIRIYQMDVLNDKNDWKTKLSTTLEKKYSSPEIVCIGDIY